MDDQSKGSQTALPDKGKWILLIDKEITQVNISDSKFYAEGVNPVNDDLKETGKSRVNIVGSFFSSFGDVEGNDVCFFQV